MAYYKIQPDKHHHIKCSFHPDHKPSCKIYPDTYHCFACGKTGDVIQFIQDKEGITKREAIIKSESFINRYEPKLKSMEQIRDSVITNWLKHYNLREVQYMAGHRFVSSTERYRTDNLEDLQKELEKYHPLK